MNTAASPTCRAERPRRLDALLALAIAQFTKLRTTGAVHLISAQVFAQFISFCSSLLVVRFLKPDELAESRLIQNYSSYITLLAGMGVVTGIVTFFPRERDEAVRRRWLDRMVLICAGLAIVLSVVAGALSAMGYLMTKATTAYWFRWALLASAAYVTADVCTAYYQAGRQVRKLSGVQSLVRLGNFGLVVGGAWKWGFPGYVCAIAVGAWVYALSLYLSASRPSGAGAAPLPAGIWRTSWLALLASGLYVLGRTLDLVIMDRFVSDRALMGCYSLATALVAVPQLVTSVVQQVAVPYFASHHSDKDWLRRTALRTQAFAALGSLGIAVCFYGGSLFLIHFVYKPAYLPTGRLLVPMLAAFCLGSTFHLLSATLIAGGLMRVNFKVAAAMFPVSAACSYLAIRHFGVWGGVWAQPVNALLYAIVQHSAGWRALWFQQGAARTETV